MMTTLMNKHQQLTNQYPVTNKQSKGLTVPNSKTFSHPPGIYATVSHQMGFFVNSDTRKLDKYPNKIRPIAKRKQSEVSIKKDSGLVYLPLVCFLPDYPEVNNLFKKIVENIRDDINTLDLKTFDRTNKLIKKLRSLVTENKFWWDEPLGNVSFDKEIVLEWWHKEKKLTIYISSNSIDFVKVWGPDMDNEMEYNTMSLKMEELKFLWQWLGGKDIE